MESLQTSCPNCGSSFKISQQQLNAAGGQVRCGSCRHVFDAQSRAVSTSRPIATHGISATSRQLGLNTLDGDIGEFSESFLDLNKTGQGTSPFLDMSDLDKALSEKEEDWTQALLDEDDKEPEKRPEIPDYLSLGENSLKNKVNDTLSLSSSNLSLSSDNLSLSSDNLSLSSDNLSLNTPDSLDTSAELKGQGKLDKQERPENKKQVKSIDSFSAVDDFDFLEESEADREIDEYSDTFEAKLDALFGDDSSQEQAGESGKAKTTNDEFDPFEGLNDSTLSQPVGSHTAQPTGNSPVNNKADLIQQIQVDPLELTLPSKRWKKLKIFGGVVLVLALLCLPVLQYAKFNLNELAQKPQLRPILTQVCDAIGCHLPSQNNINLIKTGNLVVRTHPEKEGALAIDAVLTNRANYSQPFPMLELLFTDSEGAVVAARAFKPSEYLKGELLGETVMKERQPVHVALSIQDPGERAVGYALQLKPAP